MSSAATTDPLALELARWLVRTGYDDLPAALIDGMKKSMLDTLGVAWAAWRQEDVARIVPAAASLATGSDSAIWGTLNGAPAPYAALANGILAAALDYDSLQEAALVHGDICIWPAAVALAEREKKSGRDLLTAVALGSEVAYRLGAAATDNTGWFYTSINGCFGAAAACGKLLGLDEQAMCNALAIVMSRAAGTQQPAIERAGTKRVQSAFAAQAGLEAALLAAHGLDGPTGAIDGKQGLFAKYEGGDRAVVLDRLGRTYLTERLSYKKFPCCACSHAAMEAALHLRRDHELTAADISGIEVTITPYMSKLVGAPFDPAGNPTVTAQFSIRYGVAATLLRGGFGVADILPQNVLATDVTELANRVVVTEFEGHEGRLAPATLTLTLADGQTVSKHVDTIPGSPDTPLSPQDFTAKITDCVTQGDHALSQAQCERLFGAVERLEAFDDISVLFPWIFEGETGHETTRAGA